MLAWIVRILFGTTLQSRLDKFCNGTLGLQDGLMPSKRFWVVVTDFFMVSFKKHGTMII